MDAGKFDHHRPQKHKVVNSSQSVHAYETNFYKKRKWEAPGFEPSTLDLNNLIFDTLTNLVTTAELVLVLILFIFRIILNCLNYCCSSFEWPNNYKILNLQP